MTYSIDVSFIIPCFNEEKWIKTTIKKIHEELNSVGLSYEVIVVDNKSQDNSANIALSAGSQVYSSSAKTVAAVRNSGFSKSRGNFIVFLDSDVHLGRGWGQAFSEILRSNMLGQETIIGSHCTAPDNLKEPLSSWYRGIEKDSRNTHLGTGHMIMSKQLFENIGMFNPNLTSGEDYEFCQRVLQAGGRIDHNYALKAYHMGYPATIKDFINRECWHGTSDFTSFSSVIKSKVALASLIFVALNIFLLYFLISGRSHLLALSVSFLASFLILIVIKKFGYTGVRTLIFRCITAYFYFLGRSMSIKNLFSRN